MDASVRDLKAHLSEYIRKARTGLPVTIRIHDRPVARLTAITASAGLADLARLPGLRWGGGKPAGLSRAERHAGKRPLSKLITEDRR